MGARWTRRRFLASTGLGAATGGFVAGMGNRADAADEYDELRVRWSEMITGSGYDPAAEPFKTKLAAIGREAEGLRSTMTPGASALWPDLPLGSVSGNVWGCLLRLRTMAMAYVLPGTGHTGQAAMGDAVVTGLDFMNTEPGAYTSTGEPYNNWWHWKIGCPQALIDATVLMYERLGTDRVGRYTKAIDHFVPDSAVDSMTGANRSWLCEVLAGRGVLGKTASKLVKARDALPPAIGYVTSKDGFYRDGSFVQHEWYAYTGSYGNSLLTSVSALFALLAGSTWDITHPNRQVVFYSVENCFAPFLFNGLCMDAVSGRTNSRADEGDHLRGHEIMAGILRLAKSGPAEAAARWRAAVKGWLQREETFRFDDDVTMTVAAMADAHAVLDDGAIDPRPEPEGTRIFPRMDQVVHRGRGFAVSISMRSSRTAFYETINKENLKGWHTGAGMTYWWPMRHGDGQYTDAFWPTANPYRLPGTTVSRKPMTPGAGNNTRPNADWAGGTSDGEVAVVGQNVKALSSTLSGRKAWFCLGDTVVCLGAAIACRDGVAVDTTIDQRNLGESGVDAYSVNGIAKPTSPGWSETIADASWAHLEGHGGYVFPTRPTLHALREARTGSWRDINAGGPAERLTRRYLTMYLWHGKDPSNGSYAYLLMPGATAEATRARAADTGWAAILANTVDRQAIGVPTLGFTGVCFWSPGTVGDLTADQSSAVLLREADGRATICVSDPRHLLSTVTVTWARPVAEVITADPTVTVVQTSPQLILKVSTSGSVGATHRATVRL